MGDGGGDRAPAGDRRWPTSSGRCGPRRPGRWRSALLVALVRPVGPAGGAAGAAGLVRRAGGRLLGQPAEAGRRVAPDRRRAGRAAADRPQDLALLRDLRRRGGPLAPARQLPGRLDRLRRPGRAPDLADQQGDAPALDPRGARLRLSRPEDAARPAGEDLRHLRPDGEARRALLQLVQHPDPPDPPAALRLDGRQRQPAGLPGDAQAGDAREGPRADPRPAARSTAWPTP